MKIQFFDDGIYPCDTYEHAYAARVCDAKAFEHLNKLCSNNIFILPSEVEKNEWPKDFYRMGESDHWAHIQSMLEDLALIETIIKEE